MAKVIAGVTEEKVKEIQENLSKMNERVHKMIKKEINPVYFELTAKMGSPQQQKAEGSKYVPWILEKLMTPQQAKISIALPDPYRDPSWGRETRGVTEQLAKELDLDKEAIDKDLQNLYEKHFLTPTRNGFQIPRFVHVLDAITGSTKFREFFGEDFFDLIYCWMDDETWKFREGRMATGEPPAGMRVIPRWKAIKDIPGIIPLDDIREIIMAHNRYAVIPCQCRVRTVHWRDCDTPEDVCVTFDRGVEVSLDRGIGRELTRKEMFEFFEDLAKYPVVSHGQGISPEKVGSMCNCHWDCCLAYTHIMMPESEYMPGQWNRKSRFEAIVNPEKCIGCRRCVDERCQFSAAQMKYYPEFGEERAYIDTEKCMGCGCCVETCLVGAKSMKIVRPPEYLTTPLARGNFGEQEKG